jgi:gamma-glutamyltranspeptidase/glutathione hydrolase
MSLPEKQTRAVARSARGMVASPHAQATAAGVDVLRRGGNAIDAAIATNAVLTVVYPASCGIGGDAFWVIYEPRTREVVCYNGSGRAAAAISADQLRAQGLNAMPQRGALSVTVPGAVRSWEDVARLHGTLGLDELLGPAEAYARDGFVASDVVAAYFALNEAMLRQDADAVELFLKRGGPKPGDIVRNLPLAETLAGIRRRGANDFYTGRVANAIVAALQRGGNPMTANDLAMHRTEETAPLKIGWHGAEVYAHPPNSAASVALMVLGMLANDGAANDLDWTHLAIEAIKLALDVRDQKFGEPETMPPIDEFFRPETLAAMRASIDPQRAHPRLSAVDRGGTIAIATVDEEGRAVSLIESLYQNFGSGVMASGTGIFLQNRGSYFRLEPGHPNELGPRKRPLHTLSPGMLLRNGQPEFVYASMGGDGQPQTHVQLLHNVYERGMNVQAAIDAPRFVYGRDSEAAFADAVTVESRMPAELVAGLRARGQDVNVTEAYSNMLGHAHAIFIDRERGSFAGGSDPRADSLAFGP